MSSSDDEPKEWHRNLVEVSPVPVAIFDADRVLQYVNPAAVEFAGAADADAVVGRHVDEFVHPEDSEEIARAIERIIEERESVPPAEFRFVAVDGEEKHAVTAGAPMTYEGEIAGQTVLNDITERKRRERQLRRERDRFETLFENLPSAVMHGVAKDDRPVVERVNRRFEEVFGYDRAEIEGDYLDEYIVPEDKQTEAERLNRRILSEGRLTTEVERTTADGSREFLLNIVVRDAEAGTPEGYAIYTDITERRQAERELQRQNERLHELVSAVAHDLRNPLHVAKASAEILRDEMDSAALDRLVTAHGRMEDIIDDLLTLAEQGERITDPDPVDVGVLAERAWETSRTGDASLEIDDTVRVMADGSRLQELFGNLFRNAVEHGTDDVTVELGTLEGGFYVADDGPGIPAEERDEVFESGYTTTDDGTGFGLTIVRRIVDAHGWTIEVTESADGGARFEIQGVDTPS